MRREITADQYSNLCLCSQLDASDMAYTINLCEIGIRVWREELEIKVTSKTKEERRSAKGIKNQVIIMQVENTSKVIVMDGLMPAKNAT